MLSISRRRTGFFGRNWCLVKKGTSSTILWWTDRILFPPLHIRLGLIKQFTKALDKDGECYTYLCQDFPGLTMEKLKAGFFNGPQIRQLIRDPEFKSTMNEVELETWKAFVLVVKNFLGNNKFRNFAEPVNNILTAFRNLGCNMSVKKHYLFSHIDRFPENLRSMSDEQRKRFRQDLKEIETRYQGRWDAVIMADYCWNLKRPPCRWTFQEFKETEVQVLKFEQWWSDMQFTRTYLYQCPPFSLQ